MTPFMIIFINLLISIYPRFPRAGRQHDILSMACLAAAAILLFVGLL